MAYPEEHWRQIRTNNPLERINKEIRRRTRVVGSFPDGRSARMLAAARLRHIAGTKWGSKRYLSMERLYELERMKEAVCPPVRPPRRCRCGCKTTGTCRSFFLTTEDLKTKVRKNLYTTTF